jgi:hypothetical protein
VQHYSMANSRWPSGLVAFVTALGLGAGIAACDRAPQRPPDAPMATVAPTASPLPAPSVTEGATEGAKRGETANANDQPMKSMTKVEESTSMPRPGQANDDSTLVQDSKK